MPGEAGVQHGRGTETRIRLGLAMGTGTPGSTRAPHNPSDHTPTLCFSSLSQSFAVPSPSTESRRSYLHLLSLLQLGELLLKPAGPRGTLSPPGRGIRSRSPRQHLPSTGCPDPSSSSLQSRRSIASQLIASTHVCKLTVYWKMPRNVNFIRNRVIAQHFHIFFYYGK